MAHLHLPAQHSEDDLVLAHRVAEAVESSDLYVAWSHEAGPGLRPEVRAYVTPAVNPIVEAVAQVISWIGAFVEAIVPPRRPADAHQIAPAPAQRRLAA